MIQGRTITGLTHIQYIENRNKFRQSYPSTLNDLRSLVPWLLETKRIIALDSFTSYYYMKRLCRFGLCLSKITRLFLAAAYSRLPCRTAASAAMTTLQSSLLGSHVNITVYSIQTILQEYEYHFE